MGIFANKWVLMGAGVLLLGGVLFGIFKYQNYQIEKLNGEISSLNSQLVLKEVAVQELQITVSAVQSIIDNNAALSETLARDQEVIRQDIDSQMKVFEGERLARLTAAKPGLLESRVNNATIKVFTQIEDETKLFKEENE